MGGSGRDGTGAGRSGGSGRDDRAERLAEALRENLRRRKAQARSRRQAAAGGKNDDAPGGDKGREG